MLVPAAANLLQALVSSSKLKSAMFGEHKMVCRCMGQAIAQVPVEGGCRLVAYRAMAMVIRHLRTQHTTADLGSPVLSIMVNEALLSVGVTALVPLHRPPTPGVRSTPSRNKMGDKMGDKIGGHIWFSPRNNLNNGHGAILHADTVWAGVECLALLTYNCGEYLPPHQVQQIEGAVTEGVALLAHGPLEASPFDDDEPLMLRHAAIKEAFVRLVHFYLLLGKDEPSNTTGVLYAAAIRAFHFHLADPDEAVAKTCRVALTALGAWDRVRVRGGENAALDQMEAEADKELNNDEVRRRCPEPPGFFLARGSCFFIDALIQD
ncbi:unnamed protein product [Discosporangium mesarthrocarpum]